MWVDSFQVRAEIVRLPHDSESSALSGYCKTLQFRRYNGKCKTQGGSVFLRMFGYRNSHRGENGGTRGISWVRRGAFFSGDLCTTCVQEGGFEGPEMDLSNAES